MFQIKYTNKFTGERKIYMGISFTTREAAEKELNVIKREKARLKGMGAYLNRSSRAVYIGKNFRIKETKK